MTSTRWSRRKAVQLLSVASLDVIRRSLIHAGPLPATSMASGQPIAIPAALFGFNTGEDLARYKDNPEFLRAMGQLAPAILRYPGGNGANWFDLTSGMNVANPLFPAPHNSPNYNSAPFTFSAYKTMLQAGHSQPSIVLNLLTAAMEPQIEALRAARNMGISLTRIELGNEYYLAGLEGGTQYAKVFPDAASYAKTAKQYASALKAAFPECRIGVPLIARASNRPREATWNDDLMKQIDSSIDAIIPHIYHDPPKDIFGAKGERVTGDPLTTPGGPQTIFSMAFAPEPPKIIRRALRGTDREVWITETNLRDFAGSVANTWTHGLFLVLDLMELMYLPNLRQALVHSVIGGLMYEAITQPTRGAGENSADARAGLKPCQLTATGLTCSLLLRAARGKTTAAPLTFSPNPSQRTQESMGVPSLYGWSFGDHASAILLNLSPAAATLALTGEWKGMTGTQVSGEPSTLSERTIKSLTASPALMLPAYSITMLMGS